MKTTSKTECFDTLGGMRLRYRRIKDELSMIQMTQTTSGRDRWDTPEVVVGTGKKSKMRKDRYSALLMANMAARVLTENSRHKLTMNSMEVSLLEVINQRKRRKSVYWTKLVSDSMKDVY